MPGITFTLDERIEQLKSFENDHGHMIVPYGHKKHGLGNWVNNTRANRRKGKLVNKTVIDQLDEIGCMWDAPKGPERESIR